MCLRIQSDVSIPCTAPKSRQRSHPSSAGPQVPSMPGCQHTFCSPGHFPLRQGLGHRTMCLGRTLLQSPCLCPLHPSWVACVSCASLSWSFGVASLQRRMTRSSTRRMSSMMSRRTPTKTPIHTHTYKSHSPTHGCASR